METTYSIPTSNATSSRHHRREIHQAIRDFEEQGQSQSQRAFAQENALSRSTFQYWYARHQQAQSDPIAAFFESPDGLECLHRIVLSAQFVITQLSGGSTRHCSQFLRLSQLDRYAAASVGSQHQSIIQMEEQLVQFGRTQRQKLAPRMPKRRLVLAEDETFHPEICLVSMDVNSGFILLERYAEDRKAETWTEALTEAKDGLNVELVQCVSDQARALVSHIEKGLGVHQAPDLFHAQHELCKATSLALASQTKKAQEALRKCEPEERLEAAQAVAQAEERQKRAREAMRGVGVDYHPIDLQTGHRKTPYQLEQELQARLQEVEQVGVEAGLSEKSRERIEKVMRLIPQMVATLALFVTLMNLKVAELELDQDCRRLFTRYLFAGTYLQHIAGKQKNAPNRRGLMMRAEGFLSVWRQRAGPGGRKKKADGESGPRMHGIVCQSILGRRRAKCPSTSSPCRLPSATRAKAWSFDGGA